MDDIHWDKILPWAFMGGAGMLGRLMYHAKQVQAGKRKPFSWVLLWDLPIALGMGWIALGVATWLSISWEPAISLALAISYLGPYVIDMAFLRWQNKEQK